MSGSVDVQDPLKPLDQIMEPDPRYTQSQLMLERLHAKLNSLRLHASVPMHVRQLFETAKNISLYSWFVYRLHPVAQLIGYASLERALKERVARDTGVGVDQIRKTLDPLLKLAVKKGWLKSENFTAAQHRARAQLMHEQVTRLTRSGRVGDEPVEIPELEEVAILLRASQLDYVTRIGESIPDIRNELAHGGSMLDDSSPGTLRLVAEVINQLFEDSNAAQPREGP